MVYQFPVENTASKKPDAKTLTAHRYPTTGDKEEGPIGLIKGRRPGSLQEWRVAIALDRLKLEYRYQVSISGGQRVRGGQVIDFLVYVGAGAVPVFVQGRYWHTGKHSLEDNLKQDQAKRIFRREPVLLWEEKLGSIEEAVKAVKEALL